MMLKNIWELTSCHLSSLLSSPLPLVVPCSSLHLWPGFPSLGSLLNSSLSRHQPSPWARIPLSSLSVYTSFSSSPNHCLFIVCLPHRTAEGLKFRSVPYSSLCHQQLAQLSGLREIEINKYSMLTKELYYLFCFFKVTKQGLHSLYRPSPISHRLPRIFI